MKKKVIKRVKQLHVNGRGLYTCWKVRADDNIYFLEEYPRKIREKYSDDFRRMIVNYYHATTKEESPFPKYYFKDTLIFMEYLEGQTVKEYLNARQPKGVSKEFLFALLDTIIKEIYFLNRQKLAHRKLTLDKIFIEEDSSHTVKIRLTGAKYLKEFGAEYSELGNWLALRKEIEDESATTERTNVVSFGYFLSELLGALAKSKEMDGKVMWILCSLGKVRTKCIDRSSNEELKLEDVKKEIDGIKKDNPEIEFLDIEKDGLKKWPCYKGKQLMKKGENKYLISILDCGMSKQLEERLWKFKEINNGKDALISHLVDFFMLHSEDKAILVERVIHEFFIPFEEFIKDMTMNVDNIRTVLKSLILLLREMKSTKLFFCKPSFSNLCISTRQRNEHSKKRNINFTIDNPYTAPQLNEAVIARAFGEMIYSLPFGRMVEFKDNRPVEEAKSFEGMNKEWTDLLSHLARGEDSLTRIRCLDFFTGEKNKENKRKYKMYEIVKENSKRKRLGNGSFGEVYECKLRYGPSERFAYKKIQGRSDDAKKEIERHNKLKDCDYVVRLHDNFEIKQTHYLILEKFDSDLKNHIKNNRPIKSESLKLIAKNIAKALKYMHDINMEHNDVKISNVFVLYDKFDNSVIAKVKLGDLGIGKTSYYSPPVNWGDKARDIWAFGVTLLLVAAGKLDEETERGISMATISAKNVDTILGAQVDKKLKRLIKSCLSIDRTPSMNDIINEPYLK